MLFKRSGSKIFGVTFNAKETAAIDAEIKKQMIEADKQFGADIDACVLYTLYSHYGWKKKRLRQFYDAMKQERDALIKYYSMPNDYVWLCKHRLKEEIDVDVDEWMKDMTTELEREKKEENDN